MTDKKKQNLDCSINLYPFHFIYVACHDEEKREMKNELDDGDSGDITWAIQRERMKKKAVVLKAWLICRFCVRFNVGLHKFSCLFFCILHFSVGIFILSFNMTTQ